MQSAIDGSDDRAPRPGPPSTTAPPTRPTRPATTGARNVLLLTDGNEDGSSETDARPRPSARPATTASRRRGLHRPRRAPQPAELTALVTGTPAAQVVEGGDGGPRDGLPAGRGGHHEPDPRHRRRCRRGHAGSGNVVVTATAGDDAAARTSAISSVVGSATGSRRRSPARARSSQSASSLVDNATLPLRPRRALPRAADHRLRRARRRASATRSRAGSAGACRSTR